MFDILSKIEPQGPTDNFGRSGCFSFGFDAPVMDDSERTSVFVAEVGQDCCKSGEIDRSMKVHIVDSEKANTLESG